MHINHSNLYNHKVFKKDSFTVSMLLLFLRLVGLVADELDSYVLPERVIVDPLKPGLMEPTMANSNEKIMVI